MALADNLPRFSIKPLGKDAPLTSFSVPKTAKASMPTPKEPFVSTIRSAARLAKDVATGVGKEAANIATGAGYIADILTGGRGFESNLTREQVAKDKERLAPKGKVQERIHTIANPGTELVAPGLEKAGVPGPLAFGLGLGVDIAIPGPGELKSAKALKGERAIATTASELLPVAQKVEIPGGKLEELLPENPIPRQKAIRPESPTKGSKPVSYDESISKSIDNSQAKEALVKSEVGDTSGKTPKNPGLVAGSEKNKDISGFMGQARDVYRNFEAFFGKNFPKVKSSVLDPFDAAKGRFVDEQRALTSELKKNVVDRGIKKGSKESEAVMDFGEKKIGQAELIQKFGPQKADDIIQASNWFRQKYDQLLDEVNSVRSKIYPNSPEKLVPKRKDYFRHFQELGGFGGLKNLFESPAGIDPALSGISPFTKPKSKFLSFAQRRLGAESERDAVGGFLNYVPSFSYAKHIDPQIGMFRELASDLAIQTSESRNANNFIEFLQDFANDLSGKTNAADRYIQKVIPGGRKAFSAIEWLNKRVKANTILGNLSSSVAQIFNVPQGIASAKGYAVPGVLKTLGGIFAKNKPMSESAFIKERYIKSTYNQFDESLLAKPKQFASWITGVLDEIGTKFIWNSHYEKALGKKMSNPVKYADDITRRLVAGRGVGEVPLLQKSKVFQIVAPFQLEVGNLWFVMKDMMNAKDFGGLATLFMANWLLNRVAEQVRGSDVTFDPINAVYEGVLALQEEEDRGAGVARLAGRVGGEVLSNVPLGQTLAALYPEYGFGSLGSMTRRELFGEGDPTRFGGGLLVGKGLQDPLFKILPPFGGAQIKKTIEGTKAYNAGGVTKKDGDSMFDIEQNTINRFRTSAFGKYSTPEAREYFKPKKTGTSADLLP